MCIICTRYGMASVPPASPPPPSTQQISNPFALASFALYARHLQTTTCTQSKRVRDRERERARARARASERLPSSHTGYVLYARRGESARRPASSSSSSCRVRPSVRSSRPPKNTQRIISLLFLLSASQAPVFFLHLLCWQNAEAAAAAAAVGFFLGVGMGMRTHRRTVRRQRAAETETETHRAARWRERRAHSNDGSSGSGSSGSVFPSTTGLSSVGSGRLAARAMRSWRSVARAMLAVWRSVARALLALLGAEFFRAAQKWDCWCCCWEFLLLLFCLLAGGGGEGGEEDMSGWVESRRESELLSLRRANVL